MDTDPRPDDLSETERRLSAWEPDPRGLDPDAMLFAAGRAAARGGPSRFLWPALACSLAVLAAGLGAWGSAERAGRLALAGQLRQLPQAPSPAPSPVVLPAEAPTADEPAPSSFLTARHALERGLDAWTSQAVVRAGPPGPPPQDTPVLRVGQREALLDP
jgi:hypothetical protein